MSDLTALDLLKPGEPGDALVEVRLTARELVSVHCLVQLAEQAGLPALARAQMDMVGVGDYWSLASRSAWARLGLALARVIQPERAATFAIALARLDQEQASLNHGEEV